ncbi:MAG: V-type ATPase subunit, partial [Coprobacillus sp.]
MSSFSSNAILAKARAMYSRRLTEQNYEELLKRRSINDLVAYLKSDTAYGESLSDLKEVNIHRGQLESLLNKEIFLRLDRLMRFASKKELEFYKLGVIELEIQLILTKARLIVSDYYTGYEIEIPDYLNKYTSFDLYGLLSVMDYEGLLVVLRGTKYYDALLKFKPKDDEPLDSNLLELELKHIYYKEYVDTVTKLFKGKKRKDLLTMINTSIELQNITKIYRLKKYFNATPSQIRETLFMEHSRIPKSVMNDLIEAKDASDFLKKLADSPYKLYVDDQEFIYIEYYTEKIRYNLAKRFMRFSTDSALVYMTYKFVYQVEIDNLKHIIEGLRYGEAPSQIESMLIY